MLATLATSVPMRWPTAACRSNLTGYRAAHKDAEPFPAKQLRH